MKGHAIQSLDRSLGILAALQQEAGWRAGGRAGSQKKGKGREEGG